MHPLEQSYEDYLSDEPNQYDIPDGLSREEYERLQLDHSTGEMDFPDCDRKIEIGGRHVTIKTVPCNIAVYFHTDRDTGKSYLVIDVDNESDEDEPLLMKLYRNDAPVYVEGLDYRT